MSATGAAGVIVLALGLAACGHTSGSVAPPASDTGAATTATATSTAATSVATTATATTGTLTGVVRLYVGPLNPTTGKAALTGSPGAGWSVVVRSGARTAAEATSDSAGSFRFDLAPGRYTLACGQQPRVVVVAGRTVSVDCDVPVP